jgi:hypothetical protein
VADGINAVPSYPILVSEEIAEKLLAKRLFLHFERLSFFTGEITAS